MPRAIRVWMGGADRGLSRRIRRVQEYVAVRVGEIAGLDELAGVAGLSRYHFARVFREEVGQSPWSYVREARARRAMDLLREGRSPAEAAHEAGFADQSHLTRTLREVAGRTPAEYRRAHVRGERQRDESERKIVQESDREGPDHAAETTTEASWNRTSRDPNSRPQTLPATPSRSGSSSRGRS